MTKISGPKSGDFLFPSDNFEGFATLDLAVQGDSFDYPLVWGSQARTKSFKGKTIIFYTEDERFNALGKAVMYGPDGAQETGICGWDTEEEAIREAKQWAEDEELPYIARVGVEE